MKAVCEKCELLGMAHIQIILSLRFLPFLVLKWQTTQNAYQANTRKDIFIPAWGKNKLEMYLFGIERMLRKKK